MTGATTLYQTLSDPEYGHSYLSEQTAFKRASGHQFFGYYSTVRTYPTDICRKAVLMTICSPRVSKKARYISFCRAFLPSFDLSATEIQCGDGWVVSDSR